MAGLITYLLSPDKVLPARVSASIVTPSARPDPTRPVPSELRLA